MAQDLPHQVLSEAIDAALDGWRLRSAVFLTFQFEPGFFEKEVLPVVLDLAVSHAPKIRLLQLEHALRELRGEIAVYYDANGLVAGGDVAAHLDVRRIAVRHPTGIFHPKNLFLLCEKIEPEEDGLHEQALFVWALSANLTQAGWWENVEAGHVETITAGERTLLRDDVRRLLRRVRSLAPTGTDHRALQEVLEFLGEAEQGVRRTLDGELHPHFHGGSESFPEFLDAVAGSTLRGCCLEVVSPYFDNAGCSPLAELIRRFEPRETRVYLPRTRSGEAACSPATYQAVRDLGAKWANLPPTMIRRGAGDATATRFVHAKVYRFFRLHPKTDLQFVGSVNLTSAAHQKGGTLETGFLVQVESPRRPDFWLTAEERVATTFAPPDSEEDAVSTRGIPLRLRFHWDRHEAEAWWDAETPSPPLVLRGLSIELGSSDALAPRRWTSFAPEIAGRFETLLKQTSIVEVHGASAEPARVLVQEEGMAHKPSLEVHLSVADILAYWSLFTPEQRTTFLGTRADELADTAEGAELVARVRLEQSANSMFDRFAGMFHGFGCLERGVRESLADGRERDAEARLFGKKCDSLGTLLDRAVATDGLHDYVDRYVVLLCAKQVAQELARDYPDFWKLHSVAAKEIEDRLAAIEDCRARIAAAGTEEMTRFLAWFEPRFLKRAQAREDDA